MWWRRTWFVLRRVLNPEAVKMQLVVFVFVVVVVVVEA